MAIIGHFWVKLRYSTNHISAHLGIPIQLPDPSEPTEQGESGTAEGFRRGVLGVEDDLLARGPLHLSSSLELVTLPGALVPGPTRGASPGSDSNSGMNLNNQHPNKRTAKVILSRDEPETRAVSVPAELPEKERCGRLVVLECEANLWPGLLEEGQGLVMGEAVQHLGREGERGRREGKKGGGEVAEGEGEMEEIGSRSRRGG